MRASVTVLFVLFSFCVEAQNLVLNPSFECGTDICSEDEQPLSFGDYACHWSCPTFGTSDIFSSLISNKACYSGIYNHSSLPLGSQKPRTGDRYAGVYTYEGGPANSSVSYREYLQIKLTAPLIPGEYYCAEMYVSAADIFNYTCNGLGMYFSKDAVSVYDKIDTLSFSPQVVATQVIRDTVNWVRVSGTFKAMTSASYLIIGNFQSDLDTDVSQWPGTFDNYYNHSYYFIDDVSVEHLPKRELIHLPAKEICQGDETSFKIEGFDDVTWYQLPDTTNIFATGNVLDVYPKNTVEYLAIIRNCNLIVRDTAKIKVDTFLKVDLGKDTTICAGSSITLDAGTLLGSVYQWQDGSNDQFLIVNQTGNYSVYVSNPFNDCVGQDDINVYIKRPPSVELGKDTVVCKEFFPLKAGYDSFLTYLWSTGSTDSLLTPNESGKYWVTVSNNCGQTTDTIRIFSSRNIFLPNVVTLNDDKLNGEFKVAVMNSNQSIDFSTPVKGALTVYNRWGEPIFYDSNYLSGWPSAQSNIDSGIYYCTFNYAGCSFKSWLQIMK